jgi:hypothetical protein
MKNIAAGQELGKSSAGSGIFIGIWGITQQIDNYQ